MELLRAEAAPVSGESLARELGISRVALWKRVQALNAWGYGIRADHRGYELARDDGLALWELDAPGKVRLLARTGSTMDDARSLAQENAPSGSLAIALEQERGRGKGGGPWLQAIAASGADVVGLDWTVHLGAARAAVGDRVALQGNLDPNVLFAPPEVVRAQAVAVLDSFGPPQRADGRWDGHVFNLGHGISQHTPPEHVAALVEAVHDHSRRQRAATR